MAEVDLIIAGRPYKVACRDGEEEALRAAARLVDSKSREALSGLGTLSEARQLLFAGLLLADQLLDQRLQSAVPEPAPAPPPPPLPPPPPPAPAEDPRLVERVSQLSHRLELLAEHLEAEARPS